MSGNSNNFPQSGVKETFDPADSFRGQNRPEHQLHRDSEPLPGNNSSYDQPQSNDLGICEQRRDVGATGIDKGTPQFQDLSHKQSAFDSNSPLNVQPIDQGVSIDGRGDLPEGHANMADKMIGKVQKVTGKYINKPELQEKGELRETGGKLAVAGDARAPRD